MMVVNNYGMQEEGWVVCRAFKKPTPNHRQDYEAWNHAYYLRNHHNNNVITSRLPSSMDLLITTENHMIMNNNNNPNINEATAFDHNYNSVQELVSNHIFSDIQLMNELPKLDSPSSISPNLATSNNNESLQQNISNNGINNEDFIEDERSNNSGQYIDWKNLDSLLVSQVTDATASSSFAQFSNFPSSIAEENQNHHLLGCFREL